MIYCFSSRWKNCCSKYGRILNYFISGYGCDPERRRHSHWHTEMLDWITADSNDSKCGKWFSLKRVVLSWRWHRAFREAPPRVGGLLWTQVNGDAKYWNQKGFMKQRKMRISLPLFHHNMRCDVWCRQIQHSTVNWI